MTSQFKKTSKLKTTSKGKVEPSLELEPGTDLAPDTRTRILEVAAKLFAKQGYEGTSVRDIAKELGIANPSIYYHFKSKADVLVELLTEPLRVVEIAIAEAKGLAGEARTRRIIEGFLDSLEAHQGIVLTASPDDKKILESHRFVAFEMRPYIIELLAETTAEDNRDVRVMMAIGAVEGVITGLKNTSANNDTFVKQLRNQREVIVNMILKILR
jgi:AcrR family transcriptional regulator